VVRDTKTQQQPKDQPVASSRDTAASSQRRRARRRSFVFSHTAIANPDIARDIVVRADEDFDRIFGSDD
jgi:hypothetical protein